MLADKQSEGGEVMRKILVVSMVLAFLVALAAGPALATNGYQLIGIGQIQKSMGGAVTAAPMDAMTAITNPAGMSRVGKRADFSMEMFLPDRKVDFSSNYGESSFGGTHMYGVPAIGWTAPANDAGDVYFGGGMYGTSGLGVDYEELVVMPGSMLDMMTGSPSGTYSNVTFNGFSAVQFWKMAPTVAVNLNNKLSVGVALNMDYQSVAISETINNIPLSSEGSMMFGGAQSMDVKFDLGRPTSQMGFGATVGVLYDPTDMITLGAMYSTKQYFSESEFRVGTGDVSNFMGATGQAGTYKMDLDFPQQFAVGIAVKPTERLIVDFDVKWINWESTHDKVKFTGPSNSFMTSSMMMTDSVDLEFGWENQWVYALGTRYKATDKLTLSAGFNYAKSPIDEADVFNNLVFPAVVEKHLALGFDYAFDNWGFGMTFMKAFEKKLTGEGDVPTDMQKMTMFDANSGIEIGLEEESLGFQISYRF